MCFYLLNRNLQKGKWAMMKQNSKNKIRPPTKMLDLARQTPLERGGKHLYVSNHETVAGGSRVQGHPQLHIE